MSRRIRFLIYKIKRRILKFLRILLKILLPVGFSISVIAIAMIVISNSTHTANADNLEEGIYYNLTEPIDDLTGLQLTSVTLSDEELSEIKEEILQVYEEKNGKMMVSSAMSSEFIEDRETERIRLKQLEDEARLAKEAKAKEEAEKAKSVDSSVASTLSYKSTSSYTSSDIGERFSKLIKTDADKDLAARIISAEARGDGYKGMELVLFVILHRFESTDCKSSLHSIIYARNQFQPTEDGSINKKATDLAKQVVQDALYGKLVDEHPKTMYFNVKNMNSYASRNFKKDFTYKDHDFFTKEPKK